MKRHHLVVIVAALGLLAACTGGGEDGGTETGATGATGEPAGPVTLTMWHGYTDAEADSLTALLADWNATNPDIQIEPLFVNNDKALQKLTVALQGGEPPDITYQYGSSLPQLAAAPGLVDLTTWTQQPDVEWEDFVQGARDAATFEGKVLGVPALIDNLAVVYNKALFDDAGLEYPNDQWTWDDFRAAAKALTDPAAKRFGFSYPMDASEDSVWHYDPLLWQNGGSILTEDGTEAAFNSPQGVEALQVLVGMAVEDESVFLDLQNSPYTGLFNSGKIGMLVTGPWDLASFPDVEYGVEILPGFDGDHQTIAGPDMWCVFDNGDGRAQAALEFIAWLTAAEQMKADALATGHLPFRLSVIDDPNFIEAFGAAFPGVDVFAENLANVEQARPVLAAYPQVSEAMGLAIVSAMLGEKDPQAALDEAAAQANDALALAG
ncbi:MAG TPA: ABC transporter substrate-binding protein [Actinomycetota bacterium]|nr:ABC transporter substrate-binding protein [Actinomycetota bacterium]